MQISETANVNKTKIGRGTKIWEFANVYGAENIVRSSLKNKVKKIINISTDKACNPINLYG